jgi:hypothetical protein
MNQVPFVRADPAPTCDTELTLLNGAKVAVFVTELVSRIKTLIESPPAQQRGSTHWYSLYRAMATPSGYRASAASR